MPLLRTKKEMFLWLQNGRKTIDIRKGPPRGGNFAYFVSGPRKLQLKIVRKECGSLEELVRLDNFQEIIPFAKTLEEAMEYFCSLYDSCNGSFTAYHLVQLSKQDLRF